MGLAEKIEAIRRKPEHIRLRYVWFLVILCMTFIFIIWILSLKSQSGPTIKKDILGPDLTEEFQVQKESWQKTQQQLKDDLKEVQNQAKQSTVPPQQTP